MPVGARDPGPAEGEAAEPHPDPADGADPAGLGGRNPGVTTEWIGSLFDRFDEDDSETIDDDEWEN